MTRYDWNLLDKRANFAWTEPEGDQWQAEEEPAPGRLGWLAAGGWCKRISGVPNYPCADWQDSLEARP